MNSLYNPTVFKVFRVSVNGQDADVLVSKYPFGETGERNQFSVSISFPVVLFESEGFNGTCCISDTFSFELEHERDAAFNELDKEEVSKKVMLKLEDFNY